MYTTHPYDELIKRLCNINDFIFESGIRTHICISKNNVVYWGKKDKVTFGKSILKTSLKHLLKNFYFIVGNSLLRQKTGIPMGIHPAPIWANLFLCTYKNKYMSERTLFVLIFALSRKKIHLRAKISTEFTLEKAICEIY